MSSLISFAEQIMLENKKPEHFKIKTTSIGFYRYFKAFVSLGLMSHQKSKYKLKQTGCCCCFNIKQLYQTNV